MVPDGLKPRRATLFASFSGKRRESIDTCCQAEGNKLIVVLKDRIRRETERNDYLGIFIPSHGSGGSPVRGGWLTMPTYQYLWLFEKNFCQP
jgi:hypothetical protein